MIVVLHSFHVCRCTVWTWWICGYSIYEVFCLVLFGKNTLNNEILHVFQRTPSQL